MENKINYGKIYVQDEDGEYKELGTTIELKFESSEYDDTLSSCCNCNINNTLIIRTIYKSWYKRKKGKHYVWYYKIKQGFDPKMVKCLIGGKR